MKRFWIIPIVTFWLASTDGIELFVAGSGLNTNPGTEAAPWKTIQYAADHASPGATVHIAAGIYSERVRIGVSGTEGNPIVFAGSTNGATVIDGSAFGDSDLSGWQRSEFEPMGLDNAAGLLEIVDRSHVRIQDIEIRNLRTANPAYFPFGVLVLKTHLNETPVQGVELVNLDVHHIEYTGTSADGGAQGLAVYGGRTNMALANLLIRGCTVHDCRLGQSESLTINGNVDGFAIEQCTVRNNDNIGIVCIGWEGTAGDGTHPNDRARNGTIRDCLVHSCSTEMPIKNSTYPAGDWSAGGIYIDGGRDILIERNQVYHCDVGIEIASEHGGFATDGEQRGTRGVVARDNLVYYCGQYGIGIGGYAADRGYAWDCEVLNNTIYKCSSLGWAGGQVYFSKAYSNLVSGNILVARSENDTDDYDGQDNSGDSWRFDHGVMLGSGLGATYNHDNILDHNLFFTDAGTNAVFWKWEMDDSTDPVQGFGGIQAIDPGATFGSPRFAVATFGRADGTEDFSIGTNSAAIDAGPDGFVPAPGESDFARSLRLSGGRVDCGAYESLQLQADDDGDGMPNSWEIQYFGGPTNALPHADADADGHDNAEEYFTGFSPTNPLSLFKITKFSAGSTTQIVKWSSASGHLYSVYWSTNLPAGFGLLQSNLVATAFTNTAEAPGFYRIVSTPAP